MEVFKVIMGNIVDISHVELLGDCLLKDYKQPNIQFLKLIEQQSRCLEIASFLSLKHVIFMPKPSCLRMYL